MTPGGMTPGGPIPGGPTSGGPTLAGLTTGSATAVAVAGGVILADNDGLMRSVIRSVLVRAEQLVFPVASGLEAVTLARQFRARLVMLDIAMPGLNGILACEAIRALPGYAAVPIVMLTGYDDAPMRLAAKRVGANDFITKPFRPDELLARLAPYLDLPAHLMPATATAEDAGLPGARAWRTQPHGNPLLRENPHMPAGRETVGRAMVGIYRKD
jgi:CheY-like chemotaxis protein